MQSIYTVAGVPAVEEFDGRFIACHVLCVPVQIGLVALFQRQTLRIPLHNQCLCGVPSVHSLQQEVFFPVFRTLQRASLPLQRHTQIGLHFIGLCMGSHLGPEIDLQLCIGQCGIPNLCHNCFGSSGRGVVFIFLNHLGDTALGDNEIHIGEFGLSVILQPQTAGNDHADHQRHQNQQHDHQYFELTSHVPPFCRFHSKTTHLFP